MDKLAILGPRGTFSDIAAQRYMEEQGREMEPVYYPTIDDAFHSIDKECGYAVIPVENTLDGYVQRTLDLLLEMDVHILREVRVPVRFALIANAKSLSGIKRLFVQFKASGQCRRIIRSLTGAAITITESNMESYYAATGSEECGDAAIVPAHMLRELPRDRDWLTVEDSTDSDDNFTRFLVVKKGEGGPLQLQPGGRVRAAIYVMPETDRPGILFEMLRVFYEQQVNLVSIMSRPTRKSMGNYNFYMEVDGADEERDTILRTLILLKAKYHIKILGVYTA